jgi:hypothetical protein
VAELAAVLLTALCGLTLVPVDVGAALDGFLRPRLAPIGHLSVRAEPDGGGPGALDIGTLRVEADDLDVRRLPFDSFVPTPVPRSPKARLGRIILHATHAHLDAFRASEMTFESSGLIYDLPTAVARGEVRITSVERETVSVLFRDGDLDALATASLPQLQQAHIGFAGGKLVAKAKVPLLMSTLNVTISGGVAIEGEQRLVLREPLIDTGKMALPTPLRDAMLKRLDPLIDLAKALDIPVHTRWTAVTVGEGWMRLDGVVEEPEVPVVPPAFNPRERYLY